jgi:hypothetical protein
MGRSKALRLGLLVGGVVSIAAAVSTLSIGFLAIAVICLLPLATSLGQAGRLAGSLQDFERRFVNVVVWGASLQGTVGAPLRVETVRAAGAGLLIYLTSSRASRSLLKVAQPRSWRLENGRLIIDEAAYVQWAGRRLARAEGYSAVSISSVSSGAA